MKTNTDLTTGNSPEIINITEIPTAVALQTASTCERVHIAIENLTPNNGPVEIPVRFFRLCDDLEGGFRKVTPREYLALATICELLKS